MVPHVGTVLWQRPEQTRENLSPWELPGKGTEGSAVWGVPCLSLGFWGAGSGLGLLGEGAGSSRAWVSLLKQHHPRTWPFHELPEKR